MRIGKATRYKLATGASFCDRFAGRFGSVGICGGYGEFQPGTGLPCHLHDYDESITIIQGASEPQRSLVNARFCNGDWEWEGKA